MTRNRTDAPAYGLPLRVVAQKQVPYELIDEQGHVAPHVGAFLSALEARGLSPHTIRAYAFDLATLYRWLHSVNKSLGQLEHADLLDFIREQRNHGHKPRTINRRLTTARLLYRFCLGKDIPRGLRASTAAPYYRGSGKDRVLGLQSVGKPRRVRLRVTVPQTLVEPLRPEQVRIVLGSFRRYRDLAVVQLMLLCGLRSAEVIGLELPDVGIEDTQLRVRGKGNKQRMLPLPDWVHETLQHYLRLERPRRCRTAKLFVVLQGKRRAKPMTRAGLRSLFRHRRLRPDIANANPHRFRHTFGADMARAGVRLPVLQRMMGHDDPVLTLQYINLSMADIAAEFRRAIEQIEQRYRDD